jgi:hypothetical protein
MNKEHRMMNAEVILQSYNPINPKNPSADNYPSMRVILINGIDITDAIDQLVLQFHDRGSQFNEVIFA